MIWLRACWRLLRVAAHIGTGLAIVLLRFARLSPDQRGLRVQAWSMALLGHFGVSLQVRGQPPISGPVLLVANHLSWLDIPVLHAARHCRFVSKADVKGWPLIGLLATAAGTLYIERSTRRDALRVVHQMADALRAGEVLAVFPEGTTGDGRTLLPFHANLLQAALSAQAPVQPVGLRFVDQATGAACYAPSYTGDETLLGSVWRTLCAPPIVALLHYGPPEQPQGQNRRDWSQHLHSSVDSLRQK
ncbi:MAG: 1-acyl-sn-glycerol-3-phosphate acyltransferase [Burkholderiaceae bacterium]|nr:1-acyl-sn-glycerol-3-phosphate acyltransferase [Burkholderiaceae bacterium]